MKKLFLGCLVLVACSSPPPSAPCDCSKIKAVEPVSCPSASAPTPTTDPQLLLMEKQQQLAQLQKEIAEIKASLQPKSDAPKEAAAVEPDKTAKTAKKTKEPEKAPEPKVEPKPTDAPKKVPGLKIVPR